MTKLHLGCGKRHIPGFVHVDLDDYPHIDHRHRVDQLPMFEDCSVELIYASHVLEYFDRVQVLEVLNEWRRVLSIGGTLRLGVPDFDALTTVYHKTGEIDRVLGPIFGRFEIAGLENSLAVLYHKTVYDYLSLKLILEENGFQKVRKWDWRETLHKDHDDYSQAYFPHMDKDNGILISLNVEGDKI